MARPDPQVQAHLEWIGFVRPTGLVVSAPALVRAGVILNRRDYEGQRLLKTCVSNPDDAAPVLPDFRGFAEKVLGWSFSPKGYSGTPESPIPDDLQMQLPDSQEVFYPDFAVLAEPSSGPTSEASPAREEDPETSAWQLVVSVCPPGADFDRVASGGRGLEISPHSRMERLLRHTGVPAGLLFNGHVIRLVSAPRGENSGWLDFRVGDMMQTAGRPICAAMRELLGQTRLLSAPRDRRLAALLKDSRKFQNEVSERLAQQVLHALYELLRGFQAADDATQGELLTHQMGEDPDEIYRGLLTVVLRLVYLLYTEERDMLPQDETFLGAYSISGLYERLRADAAVYPDTMDQRYGAWGQLLALWRMVHGGAYADGVSLSPSYGDLFHPDRYPFLEGRRGNWQTVERIRPPRVGDGAIHRVLEKLIVLDSERISYRALDVEHIGSVYETMMGFRLERATGRSIAIKAVKKHGAPATVDLESLLEVASGGRAKWIKDRTDRTLTPKVSKPVREAETIDDLHAALANVIDRNATPDLVPAGAMVLQPSEERRKSGLHYTPRELTEPIVRIALKPILQRLRTEAGVPISPEQILDLKVCDPAMGSGAFLVEACRQLAEALIEAWRAHHVIPEIPSDDDLTIYARRLVAQRCLYGVDRNPKAVDLAKLSLWLTTLAKDHPLTFLDHALREGDSLVGLSIRQLQSFHWKGNAKVFEAGFEALRGRRHLEEAAELRQLIREADETVPEHELRELLKGAQEETNAIRLLGDLVLAAFFQGTKAREREIHRQKYAAAVLDGEKSRYRTWLEELRRSDPPLAPFHWEIEFPEVFDRDNPGFDVIVGNPPFLGGKRISTVLGTRYRDWLNVLHQGSNRNADLVSHFFRRAFDLLRDKGTFGLIASNTIAQGDTRASGLTWICSNGGEIYRARPRLQWPGVAAVVVSPIHVIKGKFDGIRDLDGRVVDRITAFLFHAGNHTNPVILKANAQKSFIGCFLRGMGFTFDNTGNNDAVSSLEMMRKLIRKDSRNQQLIFPFIGGGEINSSPSHSHHRYTINFEKFPLKRQQKEQTWRESNEDMRRNWLQSGIVPSDYPYHVATDWPDLLGIIELLVRPYRESLRGSGINKAHRTKWWLFANARPQLTKAMANTSRVLAMCCSASQHAALAFLPKGMVYAHTLVIFPLDTSAAFCGLQSRPHETWARFFSSSFGDGLRYTPSTCFETYPFPEDWDIRPDLEAVGKEYYEFRADLMIRNDEGLTKTYNRFHDPYENTTDIAELRGLHAAMDRAVLDAYGWTDIPTNCEFLLDYEVEEDDSGGGGGGSQKEEEAVPLSVARRGSRRGAGAALGTQRGPRRRRSRSRCGRKVVPR